MKYINNRLLFSHKQKQDSAVCMKIDGSVAHHIRWITPHSANLVLHTDSWKQKHSYFWRRAQAIGGMRIGSGRGMWQMFHEYNAMNPFSMCSIYAACLKKIETRISTKTVLSNEQTVSKRYWAGKVKGEGRNRKVITDGKDNQTEFPQSTDWLERVSSLYHHKERQSKVILADVDSEMDR